MRDAVATMGTILPDDIKAGVRDAVHVAVIAVRAQTVLEPGEDVDATGHITGKMVGIVDPFLKEEVKIDQKFWLYLYPRTITGLNHQWTHPDFPEQEQAKANVKKSEEWLRRFCRDNDAPAYDDLLAFVHHHHADRGRWGRESLYLGDQECHANIPAEFWDHIEVVTGLTFDQDLRAEYFSCAC